METFGTIFFLGIALLAIIGGIISVYQYYKHQKELDEDKEKSTYGGYLSYYDGGDEP